MSGAHWLGDECLLRSDEVAQADRAVPFEGPPPRVVGRQIEREVRVRARVGLCTVATIITRIITTLILMLMMMIIMLMMKDAPATGSSRALESRNVSNRRRRRLDDHRSVSRTERLLASCRDDDTLPLSDTKLSELQLGLDDTQAEAHGGEAQSGCKSDCGGLCRGGEHRPVSQRTQAVSGPTGGHAASLRTWRGGRLRDAVSGTAEGATLHGHEIEPFSCFNESSPLPLRKRLSADADWSESFIYIGTYLLHRLYLLLRLVQSQCHRMLRSLAQLASGRSAGALGASWRLSGVRGISSALPPPPSLHRLDPPGARGFKKAIGKLERTPKKTDGRDPYAGMKAAIIGEPDEEKLAEIEAETEDEYEERKRVLSREAMREHMRGDFLPPLPPPFPPPIHLCSLFVLSLAPHFFPICRPAFLPHMSHFHFSPYTSHGHFSLFSRSFVLSLAPHFFPICHTSDPPHINLTGTLCARVY